MKVDTKNRSDIELMELLMTCDGCGKDGKKAALDALLERYREYGYNDGYDVGYSQGTEERNWS
jgi:hypothetical protein